MTTLAHRSTAIAPAYPHVVASTGQSAEERRIDGTVRELTFTDGRVDAFPRVALATDLDLRPQKGCGRL